MGGGSAVDVGCAAENGTGEMRDSDHRRRRGDRELSHSS